MKKGHRRFIFIAFGATALCFAIFIHFNLQIIFAWAQPEPTATEANIAPAVAEADQNARAALFASTSNYADPATSDESATKNVPTRAPVYRSYDFLSDYLDNRNYPIIVEGKPWNNGSTNVFQYQDKLGGNSFWDFWGDDEDWSSPYHMWQDDNGKWQTYRDVVIKDNTGKLVTSYILVDRPGPGVLEKLWFTQDATQSFLSLLNPVSWFGEKEPKELVEWGNISEIGNLRIEVDNRIIYDGPIKDWFSGDAQQLPESLRSIFVWRYQQFGSTGNNIPIPYQNHLRVITYGGTAKPKWFTATGVRLPDGTRVRPYGGNEDDLPLDAVTRSVTHILSPETNVNSLDQLQNYSFNVQSGSPAVTKFAGTGTIGAIQFRIPKQYDLKPLRLKINYGGEAGASLPFLAFFSEVDELSLHHSTPVGVIDDGKTYLFYSNFPLPFHNGIEIRVESDSTRPIPISFRLGILKESYNTELRVLYREPEQLQVYGPDYQVRLDGNGKLVGLVLVTKDQELDKVPKVYVTNSRPLTEDPKAKSWPMGYLEGNLTLYDGAGDFRLYGGHEDWADGGFYFNSGYTAPPGGANRPFGGILRYKGGKDGYATLFRYFNDLSAFRFKNGLRMNFGHGTYRNNFSVKYGATVFYYKEISGIQSVTLPASQYVTVDPYPYSWAIAHPDVCPQPSASNPC